MQATRIKKIRVACPMKIGIQDQRYLNVALPVFYRNWEQRIAGRFVSLKKT